MCPSGKKPEVKWCGVEVCPAVLGPSTRIPLSAMMRSISRWISAPPLSNSAKPPADTTACRVPRAAQSASAWGQAAAGTMITARSGVSGRSPTEGYTGRPRISWAWGLTRYRRPG